MGAPSPQLCNLWLARSFNAKDVEAATAMYHPDSSIVELDQVHGRATVARGADGIRKTMAAYIDMKPHMDVVTHHTTVSGDFAMTRSQWLIRGQDKDGKPTRCIITEWRYTGNLPTAPGSSSSTIPAVPIPNGP